LRRGWTVDCVSPVCISMATPFLCAACYSFSMAPVAERVRTCEPSMLSLSEGAPLLGAAVVFGALGMAAGAKLARPEQDLRGRLQQLQSTPAQTYRYSDDADISAQYRYGMSEAELAALSPEEAAARRERERARRARVQAMLEPVRRRALEQLEDAKRIDDEEGAAEASLLLQQIRPLPPDITRTSDRQEQDYKVWLDPDRRF